ncbi:hypothetical protein [Paenibacillus sp. BC26]|uniref:hypothetical protein n=1 Tax=Paenibacillus sp. BC26 TaxID=1881032 RepID=UPI0015A6E488
MKMKNWNYSDMASQADIHISEVSRIFSQKKALTPTQLDKITAAIGLPPGSMYALYFEEYFSDSEPVHKSRSSQFLYNCMLNGRNLEANLMIGSILEENSKYLRSKQMLNIFSVAERLFHEGNESEALFLYEAIIENFPDRFSSEFAICYFRRFFILITTERAQHALSTLLEYIHYLPVDVRRDAFLWITVFYYRREDWKEVKYYAEKLESIASYGNHLGYALMYKGFSLTRLGGTLDEVLEQIDRYSEVNKQFNEFAVGNRHAAYLDFGILDYAEEYLAWLIERDDLYVGLPRLLRTYVELDRLEDAKALVQRYRHIIDAISKERDTWVKQKTVLDFQFAYSAYLSRIGSYHEGIDVLLEITTEALTLKNTRLFKKCMYSYWELRDRTTTEQDEKYRQMLLSDTN